jgi:hypothetical protein
MDPQLLLAWVRPLTLTPVHNRKPAVPFKLHAEHRHHIPKPRYRLYQLAGL